ncbi:MAG: hypothetical protein ABL936_12020 [Aestuariivirga sp.]
MIINRRKVITLMGAAVAAAPISIPSNARVPIVGHPPRKCAIIMVADQTIPSKNVHAQFDLFRNHNNALGLPFDEHMCFGLAAADGSKKSVKLCAKICNGWIVNMRRHGIEKIAVLAWSHRFGPYLTIPMLIDADIRLARTSGYNRKFVSAFLRAASKKPNSHPPTWLECCDESGGHAFHLLVDHGFKPLLPHELPGL